MSKLFLHICPSCASHLVLDRDSQQFNCPSCGGVFEYSYFLEDEVLDIANESLKKGEYASAKKAYSFLLEKEPHNALALRGLFLCDLGVTDIKNIEKPDYTPVRKIDYSYYINETPDEYDSLFNGVEKYLRIKKSYISRVDDYKLAERNVNRVQSAYKQNDVLANKDYSTSLKLLIRMTLALGAVAWFFLGGLIVGLNGTIKDHIFAFVFTAIICGLFFLSVYIPLKNKSSNYKASLSSLGNSLNEANEKYSNMKADVSAIEVGQEALLDSIIKTDKKILNDYGVKRDE